MCGSRPQAPPAPAPTPPAAGPAPVVVAPGDVMAASAASLSRAAAADDSTTRGTLGGGRTGTASIQPRTLLG